MEVMEKRMKFFFSLSVAIAIALMSINAVAEGSTDRLLLEKIDELDIDGVREALEAGADPNAIG